MISRFVFSLVLFLANALALPSVATEAEWTLTCTEAACSTSRALKDPNTGSQVATFLALVPPEDGEVRMGVALALGVALEPGVRLVAGDATVDLPFEVCFPDGCRAMREIAGSEMDMLEGEETVQILFFPFGTDHPVALIMPIAGLATAIADARTRLAGGTGQ